MDDIRDRSSNNVKKSRERKRWYNACFTEKDGWAGTV